MSRWNQSFSNLQIHQRILTSLNALQSLRLDNPSAQEKEEYERALKVLQILNGRFSAIDPELIHFNQLQGISNWSNTVLSQVSAYTQNRNLGHLQNANANLDEILNIIRPIDVPTSPNDLKALADAGTTYRQKLLEELDLVKQRADELKTKFNGFQNEITQAKVRLNENDETIQQQKSRLDTSIAEFQKQFSAAQEVRNKEFATSQKEFSKEFNTASELRKTEWDALIAKTKAEDAAHVDFLKKRKQEVDDIYGAIGAASLAGNFNEIANSEREQADRWRLIAFIFFTAMGAVAIATFTLTFQANPNWETFVFRLGTAVLLSVPAFYAANESSKHRDREKVLRKNFLELSTIDAYLVHLPDERQNEIKSKLSEKFFGVPEVREKIESVSNKDLLSFIEKLVKDLTRGH